MHGYLSRHVGRYIDSFYDGWCDAGQRKLEGRIVMLYADDLVLMSGAIKRFIG